jgi:ABC-type lipoprotein export system ATPase subunit
MTRLISAKGLTKVYRRGNEDVWAVNGVDLEVQAGEMLAITGPSGSGKTTLLNMLGCLDNPTEGRLNVNGKDVFGDQKEMAETALTRIRRQLFGYIFQKFYLVPTLTVLENVQLPLIFYKNRAARKTPESLLSQLGVGHRIDHLPSELSGGEMQRVAIARALINEPKILLADEPTGNLDTRRSGEIKDIMRSLAQGGIAVVMVTHNQEMAHAANRIVEIRDGKIY